MFDYEKIQSLNDLELSVYNYIIQNSHEVSKLSHSSLAKGSDPCVKLPGTSLE